MSSVLTPCNQVKYIGVSKEHAVFIITGEGSTFFWNFGKLLSDCIASHPRRPSSWFQHYSGSYLASSTCALLPCFRTGWRMRQHVASVLRCLESTQWRNWLRHCATNRKVAGSIPDGVTGIFQWLNPSSRIVALRSTQHLTEMSTRNPSWG
jgi:hypothetical protein